MSVPIKRNTIVAASVREMINTSFHHACELESTSSELCRTIQHYIISEAPNYSGALLILTQPKYAESFRSTSIQVLEVALLKELFISLSEEGFAADDVKSLIDRKQYANAEFILSTKYVVVHVPSKILLESFLRNKLAANPDPNDLIQKLERAYHAAVKSFPADEPHIRELFMEVSPLLERHKYAQAEEKFYEILVDKLHITESAHPLIAILTPFQKALEEKAGPIPNSRLLRVGTLFPIRNTMVEKNQDGGARRSRRRRTRRHHVFRKRRQTRRG